MSDNNGTASTSGASSVPKTIPRGVLARSGLPLPAGARLNSGLRAPRDLTLGGISLPKKSVTPNLAPNLGRKSATSSSAQPTTNVRTPRGGANHRTDRSRAASDRGRGRGGGRGRGAANLIQLDGIFDASTAAPNERSGWSSSGGGGGGRSAEASVRDTSLPKYIPINQEDTEDTEETISRVTKAEFIDYGDKEEGEFPLVLPLNTANYAAACKAEDLKIESAMAADAIDDTDETTLCTTKPPVAANKVDDPLKAAEQLLKSLCLGETSTKGDEDGKVLTVFQLPRLPGPSQAYETVERKPATKEDTPSGPQQYKLKNLPKGSLGKLQVLRDGRVRLISGRVTMELQMAADLPIYQEVVDVQGRMVVPVAKVESKVVCRLNPTDLVDNSHRPLSGC